MFLGSSTPQERVGFVLGTPFVHHARFNYWMLGKSYYISNPFHLALLCFVYEAGETA